MNIESINFKEVLFKPNLNKYYKDNLWNGIPFYLRSRTKKNLNLEQYLFIQTACKQKKIVLVQGPPGTGKTKTLIYFINCIHSAKTKISRKHCVNLILNENFRRCKEEHLRVNYTETLNRLIDFSFLITSTQMSKLLICAPSNAAVDEIAERLIINNLFVENNFLYRPNMLRIGKSHKIRKCVSELISIDSQIRVFTDYSKIIYYIILMI